MRPHFRMNAVAADDDVGVRDRTVREGDAGTAPVLGKAGCAMPGMHDIRGQLLREQADHVGAMHPEGGVPARRIRHLHGRNRASIVAIVA